MARIPLIEPAEAHPNVQELYRRLYGDGTLEPRHRELAWLRASQVNRCHY